MDSTFNRQYSLYESVNPRAYSSTSLNNLAAKSTSRLGSPSVTSSVLSSDASGRTHSPNVDHSQLGQASAKPWVATAQGDPDSFNSQAGVNSADRAGGYNSYASPLSGYSSYGFPYAASGTSSMMYPSYGGGSTGYGTIANQYGSAQYAGYTGQYGGGGQYSYGQYTNSAVTPQYGSGQSPSQLVTENGSNRTSILGYEQALGTSKSNLGVDLVSPVGNSASVSDVLEDSVIPPGSIYWNYIDLQGQMQGPFSGVQMNEWIAYMMDVTMIRRVNDTIFVSFGKLKEATGSAEPFIVLLTAAAWNSVMRKAAELTEKQSSGPQLPPHLQPTDQPVSEAAETTRESAQSSNADAAPQTSVNRAKHEPVLHSDGRESSLAPGDVVPPVGSLKLTDTAPESSNQETTKKEPEVPAVPESSSTATKGKSSSTASASASAAAAAVSATGGASGANATATTGTTGVTSAAAEEPATTNTTRSTTDPWKKPSRPATQVSIADLKQQELEKQKLKKKALETPSKKSPQSRWLPIEQLEEEVSPRPQTPTWSKKSPAPARSLAEIQREQATKSKQASNSLASVVGAAVATTPKPVAKLPHVSKVESPSKPSSQLSSTPSSKPRSLRSTVSQQPAPASVTATANQARPTDELVHWARVSFKDLVKGVDPMELLDVFLSLPSNNSAKDFIAESIYSYSKTLDGRRFASDFLNRKKTAELSMSQGETWKDVLSRFNPNNVVEQDPSFKVVTKKRTQKIARPGDAMLI